MTASMLALSACTTTELKVGKLGTQPADQAIAGVSYWLPSQSYNVKLTRTLAKCKLVEGKVQPTAEFEWILKADVKLNSGVGESFVVDYRQMSGEFKTSSFELETWPNGTLKSIGAEAEDHSAEVFTSVVKTGFNIARLFLPVPGGSPPGTKLCPTAVKARIDGADALSAQAKKVTEATEELLPYQTAIDLGMLSNADKAKVAAIVKKLTEANIALAALRQTDKKLEAQLTYVESRDVTPSMQAMTETFAFLADDESSSTRAAQQRAWFMTLFANTNYDVKAEAENDADLRARLQSAAGANVVLAITSLRSVGPATIPLALPADAPGIAYRDPLPVRVRLCPLPPFPDRVPKKAPLGDTAQDIAKKRAEDIKTWRDKAAAGCGQGAIDPLFSSDDRIAQLGQLMVLPFKNGPNEKASLSASFRADGSLEKATYKQLNAPAQKMAQAASDAVDAALGYQKDLRAAQKARDEAADAKDKAAKDALAAETKAEKDALIAQAKARMDEIVLARSEELAKLQFEASKAKLALELDPDSQAAKVRAARAAADLADLKAQKELSDYRAMQKATP
jgi:hypothetical protein